MRESNSGVTFIVERGRQRERERERETGDCRDRRGVRDKEVEKGCKDSSISLPARSIWT